MKPTLTVLLAICVFGLCDRAGAINVPGCGCCKAPDPSDPTKCVDVNLVKSVTLSASTVCSGDSVSCHVETDPKGGCGEWSVNPTGAGSFDANCGVDVNFTAAAGFSGPATIKAKCSGHGEATASLTIVKVAIVCPNDLYTYCDAPTPSPVISASITPALAGSVFTWVVSKGSARVTIEDPQVQTTHITPTGPGSASAAANDVEITLFVSPGGFGLCTRSKTLTVRAPAAICFVGATEVANPPPLYQKEWTVAYGIFDQLIVPMPASRVSGLPDTEDIQNATCTITPGPGHVSASGTIEDDVRLPKDQPTCHYSQNITAVRLKTL